MSLQDSAGSSRRFTMNFAEMFGSTGGMLFYGGIIGMIAAAVIGLFLIPIFAADKKRVNDKISSQYRSDTKSDDR